MKTQLQTSFIPFSPLSVETLVKLGSQVKETIDFSYGKTTQKTFSAAELWNIQRRQRSSIQRRRFI